MRFTWDADKARENFRRHGVSFTEAETAFADDGALVLPDPDHSLDEDRLVLLGMSGKLRLLVVVHAIREDPDEIRLISARLARRSERAQYGRGGPDETRIRLL